MAISDMIGNLATEFVGGAIADQRGARAFRRAGNFNMGLQKDWFSHLQDEGLNPAEIVGSAGSPPSGAAGTQGRSDMLQAKTAIQTARIQADASRDVAKIQQGWQTRGQDITQGWQQRGQDIQQTTQTRGQDIQQGVQHRAQNITKEYNDAVIGIQRAAQQLQTRETEGKERTTYDREYQFRLKLMSMGVGNMAATGLVNYLKENKIDLWDPSGKVTMPDWNKHPQAAPILRQIERAIDPQTQKDSPWPLRGGPKAILEGLPALIKYQEDVIKRMKDKRR